MIKRPALQVQLESERQLWQTGTFEPYQEAIEGEEQLLAEQVELLLGPHLFPQVSFYTTCNVASPTATAAAESSHSRPRRSSLATLQHMLEQDKGKVKATGTILQLLSASTSTASKRDAPRTWRPVWFRLNGPEGDAFQVPLNASVERLANKAGRLDLLLSFTLPTTNPANPRILAILKQATEELYRALQDHCRDPVRMAAEVAGMALSPEWNVGFKEVCFSFSPPPGLMDNLHKAVKLAANPAEQAAGRKTNVAGKKRKGSVDDKEKSSGEGKVPATTADVPEPPPAPASLPPPPPPPAVKAAIPLKKRKYLPIVAPKTPPPE